MKLINNRVFKIDIVKSGKFYAKPQISEHIKSMAEMRYVGNEGCSDLYESKSYFVPHFVQFFWLWFILAVEIKHKYLSDNKYVPYSATHYAMIEEQLSKKEEI